MSPESFCASSISRRTSVALLRRFFTLEPGNAFGITREGLRKKFDRDTTAQLRVGGLIDVAHSARSEMARHVVVGESRADH